MPQVATEEPVFLDTFLRSFLLGLGSGVLCELLHVSFQVGC